MDLDDLRDDKARLENEIKFTKSIQNLDKLDANIVKNQLNLEGLDEKLDEIKEELNDMFHVKSTQEFKIALTSIVKTIINHRGKYNHSIQSHNKSTKIILIEKQVSSLRIYAHTKHACSYMHSCFIM